MPEDWQTRYRMKWNIQLFPLSHVKFHFLKSKYMWNNIHNLKYDAIHYLIKFHLLDKALTCVCCSQCHKYIDDIDFWWSIGNNCCVSEISTKQYSRLLCVDISICIWFDVCTTSDIYSLYLQYSLIIIWN